MLSPKRQRFVEEYLIDLNATQAAIRAGYSPKEANHRGSKLYANDNIRAAIDKALADRSKRKSIDQDHVLTELATIAFGDITGIVRFENGEMIIEETANLSNEQRKIIAEMSEKNFKGERSRSVKMHDKMKALELLGKHLGMFVDRHELKINNIADLFKADDDSHEEKNTISD